MNLGSGFCGVLLFRAGFFVGVLHSVVPCSGVSGFIVCCSLLLFSGNHFFPNETPSWAFWYIHGQFSEFIIRVYLVMTKKCIKNFCHNEKMYLSSSLIRCSCVWKPKAPFLNKAARFIKELVESRQLENISFEVWLDLGIYFCTVV